MTIVDRIKELCSSKETNMASLERELNLSKGSISKWAKSSPNSEGLQKVADYFHVSVDYLLGRDETKDDDNVFFLRGGDKLTKEEKEELKNIMQMSADVYLRAKGLIK